MTSDGRPSITRHAVSIHYEAHWPYQWIGMCSCGVGIRCNSEVDAKAFFVRQGCRV